MLNGNDLRKIQELVFQQAMHKVGHWTYQQVASTWDYGRVFGIPCFDELAF